jgi:hypothetical protein
MGYALSDSLMKLLLQLSEAGDPAIISGKMAKAHFGPDLQGLLNRRLLIEQVPATDWPPCHSCECGLDSRPIKANCGVWVAVCPLDSKSDVLLAEDDLRSFRIDTAALVREIASASGFDANPGEVVAGVWHLGLTATQRTLFLALSRNAVLQPGLIGTLRLFGLDAPMTLIAPKVPAADQMRFAEAKLWVITIGDCIGNESARAALEIDLAKLEPLSTLAPRLVILQGSLRVIIEGAERHIPQQPFRLLTMLAMAVIDGRRYVSVHDIESDNSGRNAADLVRELRDCLAADSAEPKPLRALIKTRRSPSGYFLALSAREFELRP